MEAIKLKIEEYLLSLKDYVFELFISNIDIILIIFVIIGLIKWLRSKPKEIPNPFAELNNTITNLSKTNETLTKNYNKVVSRVEQLEKQNNQDLDQEKVKKIVEELLKEKISNLKFDISQKYLNENEIIKLIKKELSSDTTSGSLDIKLTKLFAANIKPQMEQYIEMRLSKTNNSNNSNNENINKTPPKNEVKKEKTIKPTFK